MYSEIVMVPRVLKHKRFLYKNVLAVLSDVSVSSVSKTEISFSPPTAWYFKPVDISVTLSASDNESFGDSAKGPNTLSNNESKSLSEPWVEATDEDTFFESFRVLTAGVAWKAVHGVVRLLI